MESVIINVTTKDEMEFLVTLARKMGFSYKLVNDIQALRSFIRTLPASSISQDEIQDEINYVRNVRNEEKRKA